MHLPPKDEEPKSPPWLGLLAAILIVVIGVWALLAFQKSSDTLDCIAAGHHDCVPAPGQ
jgi:hypothetical protein